MKYYKLNLERLKTSSWRISYYEWYERKGINLYDIAVDRGDSDAISFRGRFADGTEINADMVLYDPVAPPQIPLESYL